jgi:KaiC/GvpD/RAD55 family RecA-like ATPase
MSAAALIDHPNGHAMHDGNLGSEEAVLGALLIGGKWTDIADVVRAEDYSAKHPLILSAIAAVAAEGKPLDILMVSQQLDRNGHLVAAGGIEYLSQIARTTPSAANVRAYALDVRRRAIERRLPASHRDAEGIARLKRDLAELEALTAPPVTSAFHVVWFATMNAAVHQSHLIKGLLLVNTLAVIYGEPGSGKTFMAMDMALAVAAGKPWRGRKTKKGLVIYVAGEGAASVQLRVAAYRKTHPGTDPGIPFCILPQAVDFLDTESVDRLIATIHALEAEVGERAVLIIVDTLSRAMEGNENAPEVMGRAVNSAERIRAACDEATVGFVHHAGKDPSKGARGHTKLNAAIDTEIFVEGKSGVRVAEVKKQRDLSIGDKFAFELRQVVLGTDADGDAITSCVVDETATPMPPAITRVKGANKVTLFTALKEWQRAHPGKSIISSIDLADVAKVQKLTGSRKREAVAGLEQDGVLHPAVGGHRLKLEGFSA